MRRPISGGIDPWNSLPSISRSVRVVIFVSTMGNGPDNLFPFSTSPCNFIRAHWAGTPPWNKFLLRCSWRRLGKSAKSGGSSPEKFCPFRYISVTWQAVPLEKEQSYRTQFISSLLESHGPAVRFQLQRGTPSPAAIRRRTRPVSKELSLGDSWASGACSNLIAAKFLFPQNRLSKTAKAFMHSIFLFSKPMKQQLKKEISMQHSRGARELRNTFSWDEVRSRRGDRLTPCAMDSLSEQQAEEQHQEEAPRATWTWRLPRHLSFPRGGQGSVARVVTWLCLSRQRRRYLYTNIYNVFFCQ